MLQGSLFIHSNSWGTDVNCNRWLHRYW